jgi:hypothetical protein
VHQKQRTLHERGDLVGAGQRDEALQEMSRHGIRILQHDSERRNLVRPTMGAVEALGPLLVKVLAGLWGLVPAVKSKAYRLRVYGCADAPNTFPALASTMTWNLKAGCRMAGA